MINISDPITRWACAALVSVVAGTFLLIVVAVFRRWTQIRSSRYVHDLRLHYRPFLARAIAGRRIPAEISELCTLPASDLEHLLDPVFSRRKLPQRCLSALQNLCGELGLITLWQTRAANGLALDADIPDSAAGWNRDDPAMLRHLLRAKSIRNLGMLRHAPSWPLLVRLLDSRHVDIQLVALRALAAIKAPESFPVLGDRLQAVVQGKASSPPLPALRAAMASFDLACTPALRDSLLHANRTVRFYGAEILRTIVYRHAARNPEFALTTESISPSLIELLVTRLAEDTSADVRARTAEVIIFLRDPRTPALLRHLLEDSQWFVRLRAARAIARMGDAAALHARIRECVVDPHWRVREAAIHTLLSLGPEGVRQVIEQFMLAPEGAVREQILEIVERAGLTRDLAEAYDREGIVTAAEPFIAHPTNPPALRVRPEVRAEFLHRVNPDLDPGHPVSPIRARKPKGARRQIENDGPRYPSI